jgi:Rad52/22 family double-strand break repair protein
MLTKPPEAPALPGRFTPDQIAALQAPLDRAKVKQRKQGLSGPMLSYLEGWQVIAEANRIFGFDGWLRETIDVKCVSERERTIGQKQNPGWGVTYTCRVRISVFCGGWSTGHSLGSIVIREGTGAGHGIDTDLGLAHESAIKEAETDAMKRALMTFGNPFGLALYDKEQREVMSTDELPADLLQANAIQAAKRSGLTGKGVEALRQAIAPAGSIGWANVPKNYLVKIVEEGVKPESVEKYNAIGAEAAPEPEEEPASWGMPVADREALAAMAAKAA